MDGRDAGADGGRSAASRRGGAGVAAKKSPEPWRRHPQLDDASSPQCFSILPDLNDVSGGTILYNRRGNHALQAMGLYETAEGLNMISGGGRLKQQLV